jgi:histidinol-phosphate phosphatase family protein
MDTAPTQQNSGWTLFLDRDGVINHRLKDEYVRNIEQFRFIEGVTDALARLKDFFEPIIIVTNQQGIGKGLMTESDLAAIHRYMLDTITTGGGCIDAIYYCPAMDSENHPDRKPNTGMAQHAKLDYPELDFERAVMVGDSESDIIFGRTLGMKTVFISGAKPAVFSATPPADMTFRDLASFTDWIIANITQWK